MRFQGLQTYVKSRSFGSWALLLPLAAWLMFTDGFVEGSRKFLSLCFLLALMVFFIRAILAVAFRLPAVDTLQIALLVYSASYVAAALFLQWPALSFLAMIGIGGGIVVGGVVAITSQVGGR